MLSQQLDNFRQTTANAELRSAENLKKEKQPIVSNPFASYNENAFAELGDLDRADAIEQLQAPRNNTQIYTAPAEIQQQEVSTPELHQLRERRSGEQYHFGPNEDRSDGTAAITNINQVIGYEADGSRSAMPGALGTSQETHVMKSREQQKRTFDYEDVDGIDMREMERI